MIGILQAICLTKLFADEDKVLENGRADTTWRLYLGASAVLLLVLAAIKD